LNNLIIIPVVIIVAIFIGILGNSNYQEVAKVRDQRNLQLTLDDCKRLFDEGLNRVERYNGNQDISIPRVQIVFAFYFFHKVTEGKTDEKNDAI
jgi:hypothetical protein